jgi:hypothetical protein
MTVFTGAELLHREHLLTNDEGVHVYVTARANPRSDAMADEALKLRRMLFPCHGCQTPCWVDPLATMYSVGARIRCIECMLARTHGDGR